MLNNFFLVLQFTLLLALVSSCSSSDDNQNKTFKFSVGKYKFVMSDSTGKKLINGTLEMKAKSDNNISGTYEIVNIYDKDFPGLSAMDGTFAGNIIPAEKKVFINTNPRIADSNVFWNMLIGKTSVKGDWNFSVFRGAINKGSIVITK